MPNNKYLRSTKRERELVNEASKEGLISGRTAGSHSPFDLFIWNPKEKIMRLIQVKTKKNGRFVIFLDEKVYDNCTVIERTVSYERIGSVRKQKH